MMTLINLNQGLWSKRELLFVRMVTEIKLSVLIVSFKYENK